MSQTEELSSSVGKVKPSRRHERVKQRNPVPLLARRSLAAGTNESNRGTQFLCWQGEARPPARMSQTEELSSSVGKGEPGRRHE
ncbi:hypothetical protein AN477_02265 [Alicyclobacillus ferrooxydans]|uniref:Uncharacterized protein n=2 Tax=Alicyclobacillus ferrooxydans TaxID=471514 RepID=A0A0P9CQU7_9BACL|nr:hypothetical protein AN477_02265 [Alicyclobacillus ferrooxydans]